jgi:transcriptional regulator with XRE-family HTH domain
MVSDTPDIPFGQRLRALRERAGKTRAVLGGLVGRSEEWVKAVESGRLRMPRLPMLIRLAEVLGVTDLADLSGEQSVRVARLVYADHPAVPAIRDAVQRYRLTAPPDEPPPQAELRHRVADAWRVWHGSRVRRTDVGALLPGLLDDCQRSAAGTDGVERRTAHATLASAYQLAQHCLVNASEPALTWLVVERAMAAAQIADEPMALAGAAWTVGMVLRAEGRVDESLDLVHEAADVLAPHLPGQRDDDWRGMWGALQLHGALTAARAGRDGDAWLHWDRAAETARRLPAGYHHPWTVFGAANTDLTAISLTVDLWRSREALRRAETIDPNTIPSRERRGRFYVELARGHHAADDRIAATRLLLAACDEGVDAVRFSPAARAIVDELVERPPSAIRSDVRTLANRIGLDAA